MPAGKMVIAARRRPQQKKAYVTKKQLYNAIHRNVENKMITRTMVTGFSNIDDTWTEDILSLVAQGTGANERIGNQIRIKSIEINGVIAQGSGEFLTDDPYNVVRMVMALWSGGTVTSPLQTATWSLDTPLRKLLCPQGMLKKYFDKYIPLQVTSTEKGGGDGYTPQVRRFKYFKYFKKGLLIDFGDGTTNRPDKRLILSAKSDSTLTTNPGFVQGFWAMTYEDA